jgi:DNA-binding transcriptional MerR regulator
VSESSDLSARDVIARYPGLRDDHLRYLEKWGLVRPSVRAGAGRSYGFADLAVIRQTATALEEGRPFRAVVRQLEAERHGQLALDFRREPTPARVIALTPRSTRPTVPAGDSATAQDRSRAASGCFSKRRRSMPATKPRGARPRRSTGSRSSPIRASSLR